MSFTLVLNSQNVFGSGNNTYKYDFIKGNFTIPEGAEAMVANVQLPYMVIILLIVQVKMFIITHFNITHISMVINYLPFLFLLHYLLVIQQQPFLVEMDFLPHQELLI